VTVMGAAVAARSSERRPARARALGAYSVSTPVLEWARHSRGGRVLGVSTWAAYLGFGRAVVALTARGVALMPNGVGVTAAPGTAFAGVVCAGDRAVLGPGSLVAGDLHVRWGDPVPEWDPSVRRGPWSRALVRARGVAILDSMGVDGRTAGPDGANPTAVCLDGMPNCATAVPLGV